ncbi:MAG: hypothetical protein IPQ02_01325 [Saprospiraceae bacterium]|jgi:hypothetical protein|nr:hypothetical protein [Candidatus Defluviibacterium haderslevense]MCI1267326.1 hypothetical protein [Saprospiraceae bacterium]
MKKRNYLRYSTGIISLTLLPLFCIVYFFSNNVFEPIKVIEINKVPKDVLDRYFPIGVDEIRNYKEVILNGNEKEDFNNLEISRSLTRKLLNSKDTINGIHITINEHAKFWTFIRIINIINEEKVKRYIWEKNNFWIFYKKPLAANGLSNCVIGYPNLPYQEESNRNNLFQEQTQSSFFLLKLFWLPLMLFACLIWINYQQLKYV